jgi:uncharacterized protein (DUF58 family)
MVVDQQFLELLKTMTLRIQISLKNGNLGNKRSRSTGSSVEFSDYKEYMPGDDFRRIDWNAYGRFEKVFVKLFMQEQESPVTVFMDISASMHYEEKRDAAIKVAATFAYVALSDYDTVSVALFNKSIVQSCVNLRGNSSFNRIIGLLEDSRFEGTSNLIDSIKFWEPRLKKGITVVISDLMYDHELEKVIRRLSFKKQRVVVCHILSETELNPFFEENMQLIDMENKETLNIDTGIEAINLYKQKLETYMKDIHSICKKYKTEYVFVNANVPIEQFLKQLQSIT